MSATVAASLSFPTWLVSFVCFAVPATFPAALVSSRPALLARVVRVACPDKPTVGLAHNAVCSVPMPAGCVIRGAAGFAIYTCPLFKVCAPSCAARNASPPAAGACLSPALASNTTQASSPADDRTARAIWFAAACILVLSCFVIVACTPRRRAPPLYTGFDDSADDDSDGAEINATADTPRGTSESLI